MIEVISVRFQGGCKNYYFNPEGKEFHPGDKVIVDTVQGAEFAICTEGNHEIPEEAMLKPLSPVLRKATETDLKNLMLNGEKEKKAFVICEKKIKEHGLEMKLVRVSRSFDGNKIIFFFTADGRVDFRALVRDLASVFRARIELRQIGVRDEAKMIGGLGVCGRPLCCSQFMDGFMPVSIKMAKTQNLSLNPAKISGVCGRLMCCLKYEQNVYEDAVKRLPKHESFVLTPDGPGNVKQVDLLQEQVKVNLDNANEGLKTYRNSEIKVLRNGKGSREGIIIPSERPERYVEEHPFEELAPSPIFASFYGEEDEPAPEKKPDKHRRPRRKNGKGRKPEGKAGNQSPKSENKPQESNKRNHSTMNKNSRPGGSRNGGKKPVKSSAQNPNGYVTFKNPASEKKEGTAPRRRPRHRGGRRRSGNKGGSTPKEE